jgi:hypothetical protein
MNQQARLVLAQAKAKVMGWEFSLINQPKRQDILEEVVKNIPANGRASSYAAFNRGIVSELGSKAI